MKVNDWGTTWTRDGEIKAIQTRRLEFMSGDGISHTQEINFPRPADYRLMDAS